MSEKRSPGSRNLREFLAEAGITEMTYQTLRRAGAVSFMPRRLKGQGDFTYAQLVALKVFALLRAHGLKIQIAAEAVEAAFKRIEEFASGCDLGADSAYFVGIQLVAVRGKLSVAPLDAALPAGINRVGLIKIDLRGVSGLLFEANSVAGTAKDID